MLGLPSKVVSAPSAAIRFCRYLSAALLWIAYVLHSRELALAVAMLLLLNAVLGIRRAPLVALYAATAQRRWPSPMAQVDECALRFAHSIGALATGAGVALCYQPELSGQGWMVLMCVALMKTLGAVLLCPVTGLYTCLAGGGQCCGWLKRRSRG
jgi:hypothetical protein